MSSITIEQINAILTRIEALERRIPADYDLPNRVSQQDNYADAIDRLKADGWNSGIARASMATKPE